MADLIITPAAVATASGGWFAAKVLGPATDAVGDALKQFVTDRINKIFRKAGQKAEPSILTPMPAGFLYLALQKASFSEDSDIITDMWASLLVDASSEVSHRHVVFADILSQIGSDGAKFLSDIVGTSNWEFHLSNEVGLADTLYQRYRKTLVWDQLEEKEAEIQALALLGAEVLWPVRTVLASYTYRIPGDNPAATGTKAASRPAPDPLMIDVLARQRLVSEFDFDFHPGWASPRLTGVYLTQLGLDLVRTCQKPDINVEGEKVVPK